MKYIPLTLGKFALVDDEDYIAVSVLKWHARKDSSCKQEDVYYATASIGNKNVTLHRFLMGMPNGKVVDHKDRNPLNNQRNNLRVCTPSQNAANRRRFSNNTSGYKGVAWHKRLKRWEARAQFLGVQHHIGYFDTAEEASEAYKIKARELHGEFYSEA